MNIKIGDSVKIACLGVYSKYLGIANHNVRVQWFEYIIITTGDKIERYDS